MRQSMVLELVRHISRTRTAWPRAARCASARLNRHDGPATAPHASVAPQCARRKSLRCPAPGTKGRAPGKMGGVGLEGGLATAPQPPSTSPIGSIGNIPIRCPIGTYVRRFRRADHWRHCDNNSMRAA